MHKLKEAITTVSDCVNEIEEDLISCGTNTDNMNKYMATCIDDLYAANINLTKAITNLRISEALYEIREAVEQLESAVDNVSDMVIEKLGSFGYAGYQVLENISTVIDGVVKCSTGMDRAISRMNRLR